MDIERVRSAQRGQELLGALEQVAREFEGDPPNTDYWYDQYRYPPQRMYTIGVADNELVGDARG